MYHVIGLLRIPVPDPDLEIRRGGGRGGWSPKKNYSALQFGLKIRGERAPRAPRLDPALSMLYIGFLLNNETKP